MSDEKVSRRRLMGEALRRAASSLSREATRRMARAMRLTGLRPPGAEEEVLFVALCRRCGRCMEACEFHAITRAGETSGLAAGTPVIHPLYAACRWCEDFPCAAVCPSGALDPARAREAPMGIVRLDTTRCFSWQGGDCRACVEACPRSGRALFLREGRVHVCRSECVGCGMCEFVCPASPAAIEVEPGAEDAGLDPSTKSPETG